MTLLCLGFPDYKRFQGALQAACPDAKSPDFDGIHNRPSKLLFDPVFET